MKNGRKKILFLITKGNFGGAQRYVYDLARSLPSDLFETAVAFGEGSGLELKLDLAGIRTIRVSELKRDVGIFDELKVFFSLVRLLGEERPDVLHLNSSKAGFVGALAGRYSGVPRVVFTAHNWASNDARFGLARHAYKILHWLTILLCHETIAVSTQTRNDMAGMPGALRRMRIVHNGIEPFEPDPRTTAKHLIAPHIHEGVWIGTVSELNRNKGIDIALEAFAGLAKRYQHIAFVIIGDGDDRRDLMLMAERLGISERVYFLGFVQNAERAIAAFDIFTLTSRNEAFPYVILEAGLSSSAIVASKVGGIPEVIAHKYNGLLVHPGNVDEIRHALVKLIEHPDKREQYGKRIRDRVRKKFSLKRMVEETVASYEK